MTQAAIGANIRVNGENEPLTVATLAALLEAKAVDTGQRGIAGATNAASGLSRLQSTASSFRARHGRRRGLAPAAASKSYAPVRAAEELFEMSDPLIIAGREFGSRLFLGTAGYPNRKLMLDAIAASGTEMVTASIRRISLAGEDE